MNLQDFIQFHKIAQDCTRLQKIVLDSTTFYKIPHGSIRFHKISHIGIKTQVFIESFKDKNNPCLLKMDNNINYRQILGGLSSQKIH